MKKIRTVVIPALSRDFLNGLHSLGGLQVRPAMTGFFRAFVSLCLILPATAVLAKLPQSQLSTSNLDYFVVTVTNPNSTSSGTLSLITRDDGFVQDRYDAYGDAILNGSANTTLGLYTTAIDSRGEWNLLTKDIRPYGKRLFAEFPLVFYANVMGSYTLTIREAGLVQSKVNVSAVFIQLVDSISPSDIRYHTLWQMEGKKDYSYTFNLTTTHSNSRRFKIRFYEANLLKTGSWSWNNTAVWEGGFVPGSRSNDDALQVIIPVGADVSIPNGSNIMIGSLFDSGKVTIQNGGKLTTTELCELRIE